MKSVLPAKIAKLAERVVAENIAAGRMIALAESCTGGLVAAAITEIPGSSAVLGSGFVTYSNEAKIKMLGVNEDILDTFGAVSVAGVGAGTREEQPAAAVARTAAATRLRAVFTAGIEAVLGSIHLSTFG